MKHRITFYLCFTAALSLIFLPALVLKFCSPIDCYVFSYSKTSLIAHPETLHVFAIGRWLGGILLNLQLWCVNRLVDYTILRWISILILGIVAVGICETLRQRNNLSSRLSTVLTFSVILLPAFQIGILDQATMTLNIFNLIPVLLARYFVDEAYQLKPDSQHKANIKYFLIAALFLTISFLIYQSSATFFFFFTAVSILFNPLDQWQRTRKFVFYDLIFFVLTGAVYYALHRYVGIYVLDKIYSVALDYVNPTSTFTQYKFILSFNILDKIKILWAHLPYVGRLWFYDTWKPFELQNGIGLIVLLLAVIQFFSSRISKRLILQISALFTLVFLAGWAPILMQNGVKAVSERSLLVPTAMFWIFIFKLIVNWNPKWIHRKVLGPALFLAVPILVSVSVIFSQSYHLSQEIRLIEQDLQHYDPKVYEGVTLLLPFFPHSENDLLSDGFKKMVFQESHLKGQVPQFSQCDISNGEAYIPKKDLILFENYAGSYTDIVQLQQYQKRVQKTFLLSSSYKTPNSIGLIVNPQSTVPLELYGTPLPYDLEIEIYKGSLKINSYVLQADAYRPQMMPKKWKIEASQDGSNWEVLDQRELEKPFSINELRVYSISSEKAYRYVRFVFLESEDGHNIKVGNCYFNFKDEKGKLNS